ncbi:MAG: 4Fe-4S binding protein [Coriobacteriia bacterium]|nr:4Fe-4S binding protein [Coriobacteriia bacterium]
MGPTAPIAFPHPLRVAVASGKGGTGKTLVSTGLAALAAIAGNRVVLVDCDVEAPNDHLFVRVDSPITVPVLVPVATVDAALCTGCGICRQACAFGAPRLLGGSAIVFEEMCHGCGLCLRACPEGAIHEVPDRVGEIAVGYARDIGELQLVTGRLDVGQVKTPPIVRQARALGEGIEPDFVVLDAPPGVACSTVESVRGADVLLLVTEPTPFGLHDVALARQLGFSLGIPMGIVLNRDMGQRSDLEELSVVWDVPILARIPFQRHIAEIYAGGGNAALQVGAVGAALGAVLRALPGLAHEDELDELENWS